MLFIQVMLFKWNIVERFQMHLHQEMTEVSKFSIEHPDKYLHSNRFDIIIKVVYMYFHVVLKHVPKCILLAYTEHLRILNGFKEHCFDQDDRKNGYSKLCPPKNSNENYLTSYHNFISDIANFGLNLSQYSISVDKNGFLVNGSHTLSSSIVLSHPVYVQHLKYENMFAYDYMFFQTRGLQTTISDMVLLEFMKIQLKLNLTSQISILALYSHNEEKAKIMRSILRSKCSKDGFISYEKEINITKRGIQEFVIHMYGLQSWIEAKIRNMNERISKSGLARVRFFFFFGRNNTELTSCKSEIRTLYGEGKSSVHIPDTPQEAVTLAKIILNNNSLHLINYGKNTNKCRHISAEISKHSLLSETSTLPGLYEPREDIMLDSGLVLDFYGIRKGTDVDILFLYNIDHAIIGHYKGLLYEAHGFASDATGSARPWGEDHLSKNVTRWDLFYDPRNYGYCYGIKFVSLKEVIRYKSKRNEPNKDAIDIKLIKSFLRMLSGRVT